MSVMATSRMLTRQDLDALPDNGLRHELIDGAFVMTPAPGIGHQDFVAALYRTMHEALVGCDLKVMFAPVDVALGPHVVEPDLVVAEREAFTTRDLPTPPLLVVEVRSHSTAWIDEGRKLTLYEEAGVAHYWLADPAEPSITVLDLIDGRYEQTARGRGDEVLTVHKPFAIELVASRLAQG